MEEALVAYLLANTALSGLVADHITWLERPQADGLPAVTLQVVSAPRTYTMRGRTRLVGRLVQIDIWADSYGAAKGVSRAMIAALDGLTVAPFAGAFIENERETYEPAQGPGAGGSADIFRSSLDVRVWSTDAA